MVLRVRALSPSGDMTFGQGSSNYLIDEPATVAQIIGTRLKLFQGEWFLNLRTGIPYLQQIVGRGTLPLADLILRNAMASSPGVVSIGDYSSTLTRNSRTFTVTATDIQTIFGPITQTFPAAVLPTYFTLDQSAMDDPSTPLE